MAWKNGFYYRQTWRGGTCQSEYIGAGDFAELIAKLDQHERQKRKFAAEKERAELEALTAVDAEFDQVDQVIGALVAGVLVASGHHTHRRQWRKKRE